MILCSAIFFILLIQSSQLNVYFKREMHHTVRIRTKLSKKTEQIIERICYNRS
jgi:hypothetical protein